MPFNFDMSEILVLAVFAVILFGPEKLPELARKTGRVLNYVRDIANDAKGQLGKELGPEFENLNLADLNPKALVAKHILDPVQSGIEPVKAELAPVKGMLKNPAGLTAASATAAAGVGASVSSGSTASAVVASSGAVLVGDGPAALPPFDTEAT
ncbi:MAG TPA: sec-independent translocase [Propionicimonas sp.]|nr:sec-independent translocase [Propionicimonas sp.]HRA05833.1 sec-independent translocase [Propionicimonas sp.]